jgi:2-polyprenyl-6-methoxyphenol hydroxylase-like FAD-dependent oxidoreductase
MRVLISGGGIAGLTLAHCLSRHGMASVVIERASDLRQDGYAIDFFGTGYEVAERMGLLDRLFAQQIAFDGIEYVNAQGKLIAQLDAALLRKITEGKYLALMRWSLEEALYEALEGTVEVRFGRWLVAAFPGKQEVSVTFNDGTSESFDLLIGADGVHSGTRALVFGPDEQFSRDLGYTIACYPLADRYGIGSTWKMYVEPGRLAATYCTRQAGELLTFFMYQNAGWKQPLREQRLAHLREMFAGMGWITQQLLADAPTSAPVFMDALIQIQMPTWHQGRVALVGDACGCPTLLSGQGASLALAGAYLLAEALHEAPTYQEAFQQYEQQMRPLVLAQQKQARGFAAFFLPGTPLGLFVQQMLVKVLFRETFRSVLRREFHAPSLSTLHASRHLR